LKTAQPTLRSKLLRWLLVPLSVVLVIDVVGSYIAVRAVVENIYDGELAEIARELVLHVKAEGAQTGFDLSSDADRPSRGRSVSPTLRMRERRSASRRSRARSAAAR